MEGAALSHWSFCIGNSTLSHQSISLVSVDPIGLWSFLFHLNPDSNSKIEGKTSWVAPPQTLTKNQLKNTKTKQRARRKHTLGKCWKEQTFTENSNKTTNLAGKYFLQDSQPGSHKNHINKCQPNIHYKSHLDHPFKCRYSFPCCC